jgi:hypothetical protein
MTVVLPVDYEALLNDARSAYHALMTGQQARVFVDQNGERIEYTASSAPRLAAYIAQLERTLSISTPGPMRVWM